MTTDGSETPTAIPAGNRRRLVVAAIAAVVVALVLVAVLAAVLIAHDPGETDPLAADAPGLDHLTMRPMGPCRFEPDRGGLVAHFRVSTSDAGRLSLDVSAVTDEGADNLDISTKHVVRYTLPFYGGQTRKEFDVVVPLTQAEHEEGYRKCRYTIHGAG